jgi:hypothetical protein
MDSIVRFSKTTFPEGFISTVKVLLISVLTETHLRTLNNEGSIGTQDHVSDVGIMQDDALESPRHEVVGGAGGHPTAELRHTLLVVVLSIPAEISYFVVY